MADKHTHRKIEHAPEDRARHKALREKLQRERPTPEELVASGAYGEPVPHGVVLDTMQLLGQLRNVREAAGLTLADLAERTGIDKGALSRLETGKQDNPTLQTVLRYAAALGKRLAWTLEDEPALAGPTPQTPQAPPTIAPEAGAPLQQDARVEG